MNSEPSDKRRRLVTAVKPVYEKHRGEIEEKKHEQTHWESPDFIWEALLASAATMGNPLGYELIRNSSLHDPIRYAALRALSTDDERQTVLADCLGKAQVRFSATKTQRLIANLRRIESEGGPEAIKKELNLRVGSAAKIEFLRTFEGIGPKYARNMMMDVYHEDFRDSEKDYAGAESFFLNVAHEAGLSGWELDRLLFWYKGEVLASI
jgi:hypothetical protein